MEGEGVMRCHPILQGHIEVTQGSSAQAGSKRRAEGRSSLSAGEMAALPSWIFLGTVVWTDVSGGVSSQGTW